MRIMLIALILLGAHSFLFSQDITTEGRDFWFGFMENNVTVNQQVDLRVYISAVDSTGGKIEIPGANWSQDFSVNANSTTMILVPTSLGMAQGSGIKANRGVHITSGANISVYALNSRALSADASVILPTPALGKTYYVASYVGTPPSLFSEFLIVSTENNTEVEITPVANTTDGHLAGVPYRVALSAGQVMQVQSQSDLSGTKLTSATGCKNFAAFSGNVWTNVGNCGMAQDHLYEQLFPVNTWGKNYAVVPYLERNGGDIFKIIAEEDGTLVSILGATPVTLNKGKSITQLIASAGLITADKPIQVAQLSRSQNCDNLFGDPFMILLSPLEQSLEKITFNAFNVTIIQNYYTNIITPTASLGNIKLDGAAIGNQFAAVPGSATYSYARIKITTGNHTLESPAGFSAYVYGFGNIESFGYATGAKLDNLNMVITATKKSTSEITRTVCAGDLVQFDVTTKRTFSAYQWNFNGTVINGSKAEYTFADGGTYFVTVTGTNASDNCSDSETATIQIKVLKPSEKIKGPSSVCPFTSGVSYFVTADAGNTYQWSVDGGAIAATPSKDNIIIDWGATTDAAKVKLITTDKLGCVGDPTELRVKINVKLEPILPIGLDSLCSSNGKNNVYYVYKNPTSIYTWQIDHGVINKGQGTNEIDITWDGPGTGTLHYKEESTENNVCAGESATLSVFIEREPDEKLTVVLPKDIFQVEEPIQFEFTGDAAFNYKSWNFGNGLKMDSVVRSKPVKQSYKCPGDYTVRVTAYTGTVCQNIGAGEKPIKVLAPELSIKRVTHSLERDSTIEVYSGVKYVDFFTGSINLQERSIDPKVSSWAVLSKDHRTGFFKQSLRSTSSTIYEYRLIIPALCNQVYSSLTHNTIRLNVTKDSTEVLEKSVLRFNNYINWLNGVARYEVWQQIDSTMFINVGNAFNNQLAIEYQNVGFNYCYRIRVLEQGSTNESWSNTDCISFIPKVKFYNVITPNGDSRNDFFIIEGIENYRENRLTIYNRYGVPVYKASGYLNDWNGTDNHGHELSPGIYYYSMDLRDPRPSKTVFKGSVSILK